MLSDGVAATSEVALSSRSVVSTPPLAPASAISNHIFLLCSWISVTEYHEARGDVMFRNFFHGLVFGSQVAATSEVDLASIKESGTSDVRKVGLDLCVVSQVLISIEEVSGSINALADVSDA